MPNRAPWLPQKQDRFHSEEVYHCAAVSDMGLLGSLHNPDWEASAAVQNDTEIIMEHHWKHWLSVFATATVLAGGLAAIFHRDNTTARQSSNRCSGACPCGTI